MSLRVCRASLSHLIVIFNLYFLCSFGQVTFPSSRITILDAGMTFYFEFIDATHTVRMGLEMNRTVDYFSIGFANEGNWKMKNFDMVAFMFPSSGSVTVMDLYSTKNDRPPTDTSIGGTSDYTLVNSYVGNGKTQVLFERAYDTGDNYDFAFHPDQNKSIAFTWAWLGNGKRQFEDHGSTAGNFLSYMYNGLETDIVSGKSNTSTTKKLHSYVLLFAWALLIDIAIWIARYHKSSKYVITAHLLITLAVYVVTIVLTIPVLPDSIGVEGDTIKTAHLFIGLIMLGLILLQLLGGLLFWYKMTSYKTTKTISLLSQSHMLLGIFIYLIAKVQLLFGLYIYKRNYMGLLGAWYGIVLCVWIIREYFYRQRITLCKRKVVPLAKGSKTQGYETLMKLLNTNTPVSDILETSELKGLKWAILDSKVFEIKGFTHPGGNFMFKEIQGKEIGRYIYGVGGLESFAGNSTHHHTKDVDYVIQNNLIGTINNEQQLLIPANASGNEQQQLVPNKFNLIWTLSKKTEISTYTVRFDFECSGYKIDPWIKDIRHFGKHMKISCTSHSKTRLYTMVLSQTECRTQRRNLLLSKTEKDVQQAADLINTHSKVLPLLVKRYDNQKSKTFSSFLHDSKTDTQFIIEGPFGTGLGLTLQSTGLHYIFAAGTGIFPFLDLFDYLLEGVLLPSSNSNIFKNGFKLHIFASFAQISDFVGLDICEKLIQACQDSGMEDAVKMTIRTKGASEDKLFGVTNDVFDNSFIEKHVKSDCGKVFVCGPPGFNQQIPLALKNIGLINSKILIV